MAKHLSKNRKAIIIVACIVVVIIAVAIGLLISQPKVKKDSFTFEYGSKADILGWPHRSTKSDSKRIQ